jgi:hypothetical protein
MEQENQDPVITCFNALRSATNKEIALEQAKIAHKHWWAIDATDKNLSMDELKDLLNDRSVVFAIVASVYIWNKCYTLAYEIEDEFLYNTDLWIGDRQQAIDIYLMQLIIEKQTDHLKIIFEYEDFRNSFLQYEDVYLSFLNPKYEFRSNRSLFIILINRVNNYSRLLTGDKLI